MRNLEIVETVNTVAPVVPVALNDKEGDEMEPLLVLLKERKTSCAEARAVMEENSQLETLETFKKWCNQITHPHTLTYFLLQQLFANKTMGEWFTVDDQIIPELNEKKEKHPIFSKTIKEKITREKIDNSLTYLLDCSNHLHYNLELKLESENGQFQITKNIIASESAKETPAPQKAKKKGTFIPKRPTKSKSPINSKAQIPPPDNPDERERYFNKKLFTHDLLSREEERVLISKAQSGDIEAMNRLVTQNMKLVASIMKKKGIKQGNPLYDDIMQDLIPYFIKRIGSFDLKRRVRLSTYITIILSQKIYTLIIKYKHLFKISAWNEERIARMEAFVGRIKSETGEGPTDSEIAEEFEISKEVVQELRRIKEIKYIGDTSNNDKGVKWNPKEVAMDAATGVAICSKDKEDEKRRPLALMAQMESNKEENKKRIKKCGIYSELHWYIFCRRVDENDPPWREGTLAEIGRETGLTKERARQIAAQFQGIPTNFSNL